MEAVGRSQELRARRVANSERTPTLTGQRKLLHHDRLKYMGDAHTPRCDHKQASHTMLRPCEPLWPMHAHFQAHFLIPHIPITCLYKPADDRCSRNLKARAQAVTVHGGAQARSRQT